MPALKTKTSSITSCSESETIELGRKIGRLLAPGDVVYLFGDMGTGKTRLAKGLINAATNTPLDDINSPTFTLINRYQGDVAVYHADLYRLERGELEDIGMEMVEESQGALVVEWAEKIPKLDENALRIYLRHANEENVRIIVLEWAQESSWSSRLWDRRTSDDEEEAVRRDPRKQPYMCEGESLCRS
ncbi:MAG: tRNA (adenosine(37)-N6)-threonylcarbamoyltransferase complex ATPase subunit type 1 TsaE [Desulfomonilaceae bacterium]